MHRVKARQWGKERNPMTAARPHEPMTQIGFFFFNGWLSMDHQWPI